MRRPGRVTHTISTFLYFDRRGAAGRAALGRGKANQNPSLVQLHSGLKGDGLFLQIDCGGRASGGETPRGYVK